MTKKYFLLFLIRNQSSNLVFETRKQEAERLAKILDNAEPPSELMSFFWFNTLDGRSVAINLSDVQAVRFLWDPTDLPTDILRDEGGIRIYLRGRDKPLEEDTDDPDQLYDFFTNLEHGQNVVAYPKFDDVDGEPLQFNASEIVLVIAPTHLLDEGRRIIQGS